MKVWRRWLAILAVATTIIAVLMVSELWSIGTEGQIQGHANPHNQYQPVYASLVLMLRGFGVWLDERINHDTIGTLAIVVTAMFTGTLWWSTKRLWESSERNAEHMGSSVEAIKRQADIAEASARHIERPYVFLGDLKGEDILIPFSPIMNALSVSVFATGKMRNAVAFNYSFQNYGRTPAVIYAVCHEIHVISATSTIPEAPIYGSLTERILFEVVGAGGKTAEQNCTFTPAGYNTGAFRSMSLIYGYIRYRDTSGRRYQAGFGFTWTGENFFSYGDQYNYDREIGHAHGASLPTKGQVPK